MARAFILAGAQAVLTTLWRVPDESAAVFMKFFYQYLMEGLKASSALRKAMLSIRSFLRYSNYIHWSGYQLTGRELKFDVDKQEKKLGPCPVFPRLDVVNKLTKALVKDRFMPTDVQVRMCDCMLTCCSNICATVDSLSSGCAVPGNVLISCSSQLLIMLCNYDLTCVDCLLLSHGIGHPWATWTEATGTCATICAAEPHPLSWWGVLCIGTQ